LALRLGIAGSYVSNPLENHRVALEERERCDIAGWIYNGVVNDFPPTPFLAEDAAVAVQAE
jgi:hypothetical protein